MIQQTLSQSLREAWEQRRAVAFRELVAYSHAPYLFKQERVEATKADLAKARREIKRWSA